MPSFKKQVSSGSCPPNAWRAPWFQGQEPPGLAVQRGLQELLVPREPQLMWTRGSPASLFCALGSGCRDFGGFVKLAASGCGCRQTVDGLLALSKGLFIYLPQRVCVFSPERLQGCPPGRRARPLGMETRYGASGAHTLALQLREAYATVLITATL